MIFLIALVDIDSSSKEILDSEKEQNKERKLLNLANTSVEKLKIILSSKVLIILIAINHQDCLDWILKNMINNWIKQIQYKNHIQISMILVTKNHFRELNLADKASSQRKSLVNRN